MILARALQEARGRAQSRCQPSIRIAQIGELAAHPLNDQRRVAEAVLVVDDEGRLAARRHTRREQFDDFVRHFGQSQPGEQFEREGRERAGHRHARGQHKHVERVALCAAALPRVGQRLLRRLSQLRGGAEARWK